VTSLAARRVLDCTDVDFTAETAGYDVIVDCAGNAPVRRSGQPAEAGGALLLVIADLPGPLQRRRTGHLVTASVGTPAAEEWPCWSTCRAGTTADKRTSERVSGL
jgi:hypothetical protein